jgi:hypothetical protein
MTHSPRREKSAVFAEFHEFLSSPPKKNIFGPQFPYLSLEKLLFLQPKQTFIVFFSETKNSYAEKSAVFAEFMSFYRPPKFFLGNIFKYVKKKSSIFAENMKKVGVCRFKKVRFSHPFGVKLKIKNL